MKYKIKGAMLELFLHGANSYRSRIVSKENGMVEKEIDSGSFYLPRPRPTRQHSG